ncbi:TRAP transporter substrate-binding protein [Paracoccus xiamenensis]|uniref:TRAP transporter substrate-binding protein n=1 Tax=Paracoccus xiamenensis TaxID=2714901 RepID=UPI00140B5ECF|nr:TRAP transporter substrate-binding protein [Paracoccus xiamenensis]NHF72851.1 TRAP transporter substrate-binding protein [Paracoccus xiamenensis]
MRLTGKFILPGLMALAFAAGANAQEVTLRLSNWLPPSHPVVKDIMVPWAEQVTEATEGRVAVQILDAPLGPPPAHFDLVASGAADLGFSAHSYTPGRFALTEIAELPFLTPSSEANSVALWNVWSNMLADKGEHAGVKVLGLFGHGPGHLFTTERPVSPLDGLKGAKIRVAGAVTDQLVQGLDMVSVQAPSSESYELLSNGVADGIVFPYESVPFFKLDGLVKNGLRVPGGMYNVSFFFVMNQARFDSLSEADRAAIDQVSGQALARMAGKAWDAADAAGLAALDGKVTFHDATEEEIATFKTDADAIYDRVRQNYAAKGVDFDAALAMFQEELAKVQP